MTTIQSPHDAPCPVAALVDELAANIELQARIRAQPEEDSDLPDVLSMLEDREHAIQSFVETSKVTSSKGATLQFMMFYNAAADMGAALPEGRPAYGERSKGQLNRVIDSAGYSLLAALQARDGGELPAAIVRHYMPALAAA